MIVTCQKCRTRFRVRPEALKPQGTILRCSRCGSLFRTAPTQLTSRPGPLPGVSDEDYVLYGGPPPADRLRAPLEGAAPPEPVVPREPKPAKAAAPTPPAVKTVAPQPVAAPPAAPEPVRKPALEAAPKPPLPGPLVKQPLAPQPPAQQTPAPAEPLSPEPEAAPAPAAPEPAAPETAAKAPAVDEPWPEEAPSRAAPWPAAPLPPLPRPQAPTGLAALRRSLNRRSPLMMGALAVTAVLMLGLFAYRAGLIGGQSVDPEGKSRISFTGISGYFLKNEQDGIFYVVQGLVRNGYEDKRGRIRIKAAIHDATGRPVRQQMVYAGNVFSREELQRLPLQDIAARLAEPNQDLSAAMVRPGTTVPFMAVFGDLPESLGEFSLEAASSSSSASS